MIHLIANTSGDVNQRIYLMMVVLLVLVTFSFFRSRSIRRREEKNLSTLVREIDADPYGVPEEISSRSLLNTNILGYSEQKYMSEHCLISDVTYEYAHKLFGVVNLSQYTSIVVFSFQLTAKFQHTFVDGLINEKSHTTNHGMYAINTRLKAVNKKLDLEGNFPDSFTVYSASHSNREVLQILTPDVMDSLMQLGVNFDLEIIDNQVNLVMNRNILKKLDAKNLSVKINNVITVISSQLRIDQKNWVQDQVLESSSPKMLTVGLWRSIIQVLYSYILGGIFLAIVMYIILR